MLGRVRLHDDGTMDCGFIPVHVEPPGRPTLALGESAARIADYILDITTQAGLPSLSRSEIGKDGVWLS
jgi:hypothetical protein